MKWAAPLFVLAFVLLPDPGKADPAIIEHVEAENTGPAWRFDVTVSHGDTGWDDYADGWRVETPDGAELGMRVLYHPHVNEQPFTRSLSGVSVPESVDTVRVRVRTNVEGWSDDSYEVRLR